MKNIGTMKKIDKAGRIVLPKELLRVLGMRDDTVLEINTDGESIILSRYMPKCILCNENEDVALKFEGKQLCKTCLIKIAGGEDKINI